MKLLSMTRHKQETPEQLWWETKTHQNEQAREALILQYAGLVRYVLNRLAITPPSVVEPEDLINTGILGLIDAVDRYDPGYGSSFKSYAVCRIRGAILDEAKRLGWVPRARYRKHVAIEEAYGTLERKLGRSVTDEEVAAFLDIDLDTFYQHLSDLHASTFSSLYDFVQTRNGDQPKYLLDVLENPQVDPAKAAELEEIRSLLASAIDALPEKEKLVITLYYQKELTFKEIGHVLSVSESRACQIHTKAVLRIRAKLADYCET